MPSRLRCRRTSSTACLMDREVRRSAPTSDHARAPRASRQLEEEEVRSRSTQDPSAQGECSSSSSAPGRWSRAPLLHSLPLVFLFIVLHIVVFIFVFYILLD